LYCIISYETEMRTFLLFILITSSLLAQMPFPQDTIVYNNRFNNRQFGEYNSQGLIRLTYTSGLGTVSSYNEIYYVEEDAGGNLHTINLTNNTVDDNYSTLSIDQNDKVHISYESRDPSIFQVMYTNNISGSFSTPIAITQGGLNKATPFGKIGPDSVMHFVYYTYTNGSDNCFYRNYDLRTGILGPEVFLSNGEASGDFQATLDLDSNGKVHIAITSGTTLTSGPLKYFNNVSGSFQEIPTSVTVNMSYPRIRVGLNAKVHIIYRASSRLYYTNNVSSTFTTPVPITPVGQLPAGIQSLEMDDQGRLYTTYQSSQSASGKGFYLLFAENNVFYDTLLIADIPPEYVTRNSSHVISKGNGDIAMFYAEGDVRNDTVICDIFMKRGNIYNIVPVELVSFDAKVSDDDVYLSWSTSSETNNQGFEILRCTQNDQNSWKKVGFVPGSATTTDPKSYSFHDRGISAGNYQYRLKQIDFDGTFEFSNIIEVKVDLLKEFVLEQNYPNPFNPSTKISYSLKEEGYVKLFIYDIKGELISTLVNGRQQSGNYEVDFKLSGNISTGVYIYRLTVTDNIYNVVFSDVKKMVFLK
jgi:hypothetical protein